MAISIDSRSFGSTGVGEAGRLVTFARSAAAAVVSGAGVGSGVRDLDAFPKPDSGFSLIPYRKIVDCLIEAISYAIPSIPNCIKLRQIVVGASVRKVALGRKPIR